MQSKALHTIIMALFLAAAVCAEQPGSGPVPLPQSPNPKALVSTPVPHMPVAILHNVNLQAGVYPGTPMPVPTDPHPAPSGLLVS